MYIFTLSSKLFTFIYICVAIHCPFISGGMIPFNISYKSSGDEYLHVLFFSESLYFSFIFEQ